ncbi:MAG: magnesium-dependent phosphatase-1 [Thermofilum sp.]
MAVKLLILDLDQTLWNHPDISQATPPFRPLGQGTAVDATGTLVKLRECAEELLLHAKRSGIKLAVASWNLREPAAAALDVLGLTAYFDAVVIEPHPRKEEMIKKILKTLGVKPEEALFVDDNEIIVRRVRRYLPELRTLRYGFEVSSLCELLEKLKAGEL